MEKKEAGWCHHIKLVPFYRPGGSTAYRIEPGGEIIMWWVTENLWLIYCSKCYMREGLGLTLVRSSSPLTPEPSA